MFDKITLMDVACVFCLYEFFLPLLLIDQKLGESTIKRKKKIPMQCSKVVYFYFIYFFVSLP